MILIMLIFIELVTANHHRQIKYSNSICLDPDQMLLSSHDTDLNGCNALCLTTNDCKEFAYAS